ncbi:hypothetical protein [Streptomyces sp. NPDC050504]|uniref:hypothetical protein n=1 Tax=Streptomyces sp. NPDC050504 TaxID=3365618 RepID=UPI00378BB487
MATSRTRTRPPLAGALVYLESRKNLAGSACGLLGLALTFTGLAGPYWPFVVAGLYGAGALIAPPERSEAPCFPDPAEQLDALRADFATLRAYLETVELPPAAAGRTTELTNVLEALLDPGWAGGGLADDPEGMHTLARAIRQDIPESVDTYVRTRWWTRITPGTEPPERHLERQLDLLHREAEKLAAALHETEVRRQHTHTNYLQGRVSDGP